MATKLQRLVTKLNLAFRAKVVDEMRTKFGIEVENTYSILAMALVTTRTDGGDFTAEQHVWLNAYSRGYGDALGLVSDES